MRCQSFDSHDLGAVGFDSQHQARVHRVAVEQHGTCTTLACSTALLRSGQTGLIAQYLQEGMMRGGLERMRPLIDRELDPYSHHATPSRSLAAASARRLSTDSTASRYSRLPRTSEIGLASARMRCSAASFSGAPALGSPSIPLSSRATNGRGPTAPNASSASPDGFTRQHKFTVARSTPRLRVRRAKADPVGSDGIGRSTDSTISPGRMTVRPGPLKKSASGTVRAPRALTTLTPARYTSSAGAVSAAGDALQILPASVARLRICTD